ncbi:MAG: hypothetical protein HZC28_03820 [Spirochaetes bacterium]|nr:hypothetical protein [Spirochaetota bacterium]
MKMIIANSFLLAVMSGLMPSSLAAQDTAVPRDGLLLWLEADTLSATHKNGDAVDVWKAVAGPSAERCVSALPDGRSATAPTFTADAMNGKPAVRFDGADNQLTVPGTIAKQLAGKPFSIFMLSRSANASFGFTGNSANGNGGVPRLYVQRQGTIYNDTKNNATLPTAASAAELAYAQYDGVSQLISYLNGARSKEVPTPKVDAFHGRGELAIPFWPGKPIAGDLSLIIIYNRVLSDAERTGIEKHLLAKYGIVGGASTAANRTDAPAAPVNPNLKTVVLIGDSIRMGYQSYVKSALEGKVNIAAPAENCRHSGVIVENIKKWILDVKPDLVHINVGLHDLIVNKFSGAFQIPVETYAANLDIIFKTLRENNIKVIWSTTTPVIDALYAKNNSGQTFIRHDADVMTYNEAAREVMQRYNIPVLDLYAFVKTQEVDGFYHKDGLHYTGNGSRVLGDQVSKYILDNLEP